MQPVTLRAPILAPASSYSLQMLPSVPSEALPSDSMSCSGCVTLVWPLPKGLQAAGLSRLLTKHEDRPLTSKQSACSLPLRHHFSSSAKTLLMLKLMQGSSIFVR